MKKIITASFVVLFSAVICLFSACSVTKPGTDTEIETMSETVDETTESTTRPELKVSLGVTNATAIDERVMKISGISKWVDECRGIYVSKMAPGSVLGKTKFRPGDIIQSINGQETNTLDDIYNILSLFNPGDTITVGVFRLNLFNGENEYFDVEVTFPKPAEETGTNGD